MELAVCLQVTTWIGDREQARTLAREILEARMATVVSLIGPAEKLHMWEGAIDGPSTGWQLEMQTTAARFEALSVFLREHRFLEPMPEVTATPLVGPAGWLEHVASYLDEG